MEIIHIVLGKANPNRMNGVNKVVYQLASEQAAAGADVSVWGITKELSKNYDDRSFKTRLFKKEKNIFKPGDELLLALLAKKGKAVFHVHGGWIPVFYSITRFMIRYQIPYVYTPHGAYNEIAMKRNLLLKKAYFSLFERNIISNALTIHCIGQSEVKGLNSIHTSTNTVLLPYGLRLDSPAPPAKEKSSELIIGFMGRLDIYTKGLDLLLDGFKEFNQVVPNSRLWFIGEGETIKLLKMISKKKLDRQVILFGKKFGDEKNALLGEMDVFVHPSRNEGLPSSVLEASHLGIPCIVSKATNISEHVTNYNAGISIENENSRALTTALFRIYEIWNNQSIQRMKLNAQRMVSTEFNWQLLIPRFNSLYGF
jgi:glycosyltransferase involved in cell wall biosynthesis